jgi:asparagine synthase (glutamine-hydrolysing)
MFELILEGNNAYKPAKAGNCFFFGYFYNNEGKVFRGTEAAEHISKIIINNDEIKQKSLSGIYSAIIVEEERLIISGDIINFFPIYFVYTENRWIVSDNLSSITQKTQNLKIDESEIPGFLSAGFSSGFNTLIEGIKKTRAGSSIELFHDGTYKTQTYYSFIPEQFCGDETEKLIIKAESTFLDAGKNVCSFLAGRTAVIPLSGGFDSRLIAVLMKKLNYENVICFTYGRKTNEVEISKKVASNLGFKWYFVDYEKIDYKGFTKDEQFLNYAFEYSGAYSMVYLQEYFAVKYLKENNLIPQDSVFLPGHSGDYLGGSYTNRTAKISHHNELLTVFLEKNYYFFKKKRRAEKLAIREKIKETLVEYPEKNHISASYNPFIEDWDVKEKLSKFIFRSSYVFTFFGYEHIYPFWDSQVVNFWRNVPYELRSGKTFYDKVLIEKFFIPNNVYFAEIELKKTEFYKKYQNLKDRLRYKMPWSIVYSRMIKNDWLNYRGFTHEMEFELISKGLKPLKNFKSFNAIICRWYVEKIREKIND